MTAPLRQGWCPGALRPMAAKDGLLVRLRLTGGVLPAAAAHALADLARRDGNGLFDLSARGNLQMRGVREATLPRLQDGLRALGFLDATAAAESVRNVIASPLAGLHDGIDIGPLVQALETRLAQEAGLQALPGKFGFLVDDGGWPSLAGIAADVRFDWTGDTFSIGISGDRNDAIEVSACDPADLVDEAARIASLFLERAAGSPDLRRTRDLVVRLGPEAARDAFRSHRHPSSRHAQRNGINREISQARQLVGLHTYSAKDGQRQMPCLGLGVAFGRLDADMLHRAASVAETTRTGELRLTPFRVILVPDARDSADLSGFIMGPKDARLSIAACVGAAGCDRGTTRTQEDAEALASTLPPSAEVMLHVSGCEKGCAKASATPLTLVARDGRYDLVRHGRAADPPLRRGLDRAAARHAIRSFA